MSTDEKLYSDGLSWSILASHACADDTDTGYQRKMRAFIPDTAGTVSVLLSAAGSAIPIPVAAGGIYPIHNIYSFQATDTDSTNVLILG